MQTVWLQPKLDRLPSFFKESGFFLDSARPVDPRKHPLFDLMEETPMIGIPMRDWDGRSVSPRSISGSLVNEATCVGIISRTTSNSNHYFGAQPNGLHPIEFPSTGDYDLFLSLGKLDDAKLSWTKFSDGRWSATFTVTNHRAYCDAQGQWHDHNGHYRLNDSQTLIYALQKAHAWIMDQRDLNVPL